MPRSPLRKLSASVLIAVLCAAVAPLWAQRDAWTTVGSAGIVDEEDTGLVLLGNTVPGVVTMRPASTGVLNLRYNVVAVDGVTGGDGHALTARFRDNGSGGRVVVRLVQYGLYTGLTTVLLSFDSDSVSPAAVHQVQSVGSCATTLNFDENSYFFDVEIIKTVASATPALAMIQLVVITC